MKTIHEVESQRQYDQADQYRRKGCGHDQEFSRTMLSMTLATSWHLSVAASSSSYTALSLISCRVSCSLRNRLETALRMTRSASDSSPSISAQVVRIFGDCFMSLSPRMAI